MALRASGRSIVMTAQAPRVSNATGFVMDGA
jgi:hypothetical protein